ncbi:unnamed protein product, partial [Discosporangium mesarthrocarpum]
VDAAANKLVSKRSLGELPTDPGHLENLFHMCVANWKTYAGVKPKGEKLARINAVYKQAAQGDYHETDWTTNFEKKVHELWRGYSGTPALVAKRRFLALLREVDVRLLLVKPYHTVPWGFPKTAQGETICPYCNAKMGCPRPLMDKYGHVLEEELDISPALADFINLKQWLDEVSTQQRCSLGVHVAITSYQAARFRTFYDRPECKGFQPYVTSGLHKLITKVLTKQLVLLADMQNNPLSFSKEAQFLQRERVLRLQMYYTTMSGNEFKNEAPCTRTNNLCNTRRLAEGRNHKHPVVVKRPSVDLSVYDRLLEVRGECERLGVSPMTGPVVSVDHRADLMRLKIVEFHRKKMLVYESQRRRHWRSEIAPLRASVLRTSSKVHLTETLTRALKARNVNKVCEHVEMGADPAVELASGMFPLMLAALERSKSGIKRLIDAEANPDHDNSQGMTALMWAVKRDDYAITEALLAAGVNVGLEGRRGWTAMAVAAKHGRSEIVQLLVDSMLRDKVVGRMNADRALNHRSTVNGGMTPVMIAARSRNEAMVRLLLRHGANPRVQCHKGMVAGEYAFQARWRTLGLWLQETQAFGAGGVYTFADMQAEKQLRMASSRMIAAITSGEMIEDKGNEGSGGRNGRQAGERKAKKSTTQEVTTRVEGKKDDNEGGVFFDVTLHQMQQSWQTTPKTVEILQGGQAAPDTETDAGHTALISASYRGLDNAVRILIEEGADPSYTNRNGRTALMAASAAGHGSVVRALLREGADAASMDVDGKVAGAYAFGNGHNELAELLAVARVHGNPAALEWDIERDRRMSEEDQKRKSQAMQEKARGEDGENLPETEMHAWMLRVTRPWEDAERRAAQSSEPERPQSPTLEGNQLPENSETVFHTSPGRADVSAGHRAQKNKGPRCPKCTLHPPCVHFSSLSRFWQEFPEGTPEWRWDRRPVISRRGQRGGGKDAWRGCGKGGDMPWWKVLHKKHRD